MLLSFWLLCWGMRCHWLTKDTGRAVSVLTDFILSGTKVTVCLQPLALEIHPDGLQASITAWHNQHYLHAFSKAPTILYLQIKRYTQKDGAIHKKHAFL